MRVEFGPLMNTKMGVSAYMRMVHTAGALQAVSGEYTEILARELPFSQAIAEGLWKEGWEYGSLIKKYRRG